MKYIPMKHSLLVFLFSGLALALSGQTVPEMYPDLGKFIDKSPELEKVYLQEMAVCDTLWEKVYAQGGPDSLSEAEKQLWENCDEEFEGYWDVIGLGCSWYCGGGDDTLSASSTLSSINGISYAASNAHDLSYETAWVEGVPGYGVGEFLVYHFPPGNPRITEIIVVNGYVKSEKLWRENARVKTLNVYQNGQLFAILQLDDSRQEQHFAFAPIGYADRENWEALTAKPWWTLKFEIAAVYPGEKYDDTAITEIYFDGIDVH
jgi:hypothetical protein